MVVEDSPPGILAGKRAGMFVVGLTAGSLPQAVSLADATAADYGQLLRLALQWLSEPVWLWRMISLVRKRPPECCSQHSRGPFSDG